MREANVQKSNTGGLSTDEMVTPVKSDEMRRKLNETNNKNLSLNREVERLNNALRSKQEENQILNEEIVRLRRNISPQNMGG